MSRRWRVLGLILGVIVKMRSILNKVNKSREKMKLYCCLFPNEYEFERETLVRLWMAMEFSSQSCVENFCERYFDILLEEQYIVFSSMDTVTRRNLYKVNHQGKDNTGEKKTINKEDLYTVLEDEDENRSKLGHISVVSNCINETTFKKLQNFDGELRTLLFIHNYGSTLNKIPSDMFLILEFLRALDLSGNDIVELPRSIGNVSQLRYLDVSFTLIESLPKSIDQLLQLQTLKLQGCTHLHELPRGIKELICLRHLDLDVLGQLTFLPKGIGALTELCTLSAFIVDSEERCTIQELKFLNKLRGSFCISGLENVAHVDDVQEAALQDKKYLTHLQLSWSDLVLYSTEDKQLGYNIIASLNLNKGLQDLQIVCYPGLHIPAWANFREQQNLLSITLLNCNNNDLSLPLGQLPNLKYLSIIHMNRVTKIDNWFLGGGDEAYVAFPKLESLKIECMLSLETWIDVFNHDDFPFLSTLIIKQCPKLIRLPFLSHFQVLKLLEISHCTVFKCLPEGTLPVSLETLIIDDCPFLKKSCSKEGEDWHKVKHIPNIWIDLQNICSTHEDDGFEDSSSKSEDIYSTDEDVSEDINLSAGLNSKYVSKDGNDPTIPSSTVSSAPLTPKSEGEILQSSNLKSFSFSEVKSATRNFRPDSLLGEGGFGSVFKGWIDENSYAPTKPGMGMVIAVKRLNQESYQGHREWLAEVNYLGQLHHPNLVKLIGYCLEDEHRLLVYEFMPRGSLENHLFRRGSYFQPLSWNLRMKVALGAAKGVAFLHNAETPVIYRDFKTSNVLLDSNYTAKLSDFGLAKDGPTGDKSHVSTRVMGTYGYAAPEYLATSTRVMGTYGYAAPEYLATGRLTTKSDVYSFGVVLLEMLSGRRAVDKNRPSGEHNLVEWARPFLTNKRKIFRILDNRLEGQYSLDAALRVSTLAFRCLSIEPEFRPLMIEIVEELEQLQDPSKEARSSSSTGARARR